MRISVLLITLSVLVTGCGDPDPDPEINIKHILKKDEHVGRIKRSVEVSLFERLSEEDLKKFALYIRDSDPHRYERTFIGYSLVGTHLDHYWATTHFTPELDVRVLGQTQEQHDAMTSSATAVHGTLLGRWNVTRGIERVLTAYEEAGLTYVKYTFNDGSYSTYEFQVQKQAGHIMLSPPSDTNIKEHYVINRRGELEVWSPNGLERTEPPLP